MLTAEVDRRVVQALSHPTRVQVLRIFDTRDMASPVELSHELSIPLGTMGYHVRRLELLGMIELATTRHRNRHDHRLPDRRDPRLPRCPRPYQRRLPRIVPRTSDGTYASIIRNTEAFSLAFR